MLPYVRFIVTAVVSTTAVVVEVPRRAVGSAPRGSTQSVDVIATALVFATVGLHVARARPRNGIGWILLVSGLGWAQPAHASVWLRERVR